MFEKITTLEQVDALDNGLLVAGYMAGLKNQPDYTQKDQAYWHGFNNGQVDGKYAPITAEQMELARNTSDVMLQRLFGRAN